MLKQITRLRTGTLEIVRDYEDGQPRTLGRVYQVGGGLLVADGLVGLENPFDNKKSRPGILGAVLLGLIGLVFTVLALFVFAVPETDSVATGSIARISAPSPPSDDGAPTCSYDAIYSVNGTTYTARSTVHSDTICHKRVGSSVQVHYLDADPGTGVLDRGTQKLFRWGALAVGLIMMAVGGVTFLIRTAAIFFGTKLFLRGRALVNANPKTGDDDGDVLATAKDAFMKLRFAKQ